ncbi:uncharacterized protein LOC117283001 isoform X1 [Cryptotermes secundus]|uniref:uncharacterized protein LOC117283001 isoform X1 n=1 Tax=Cryptotermes secundus TaxID=105785 RepID=UPI001454DF6E|nr:uncharacterized protein LOC117283001 isoform X1 [Cryptotermes secundus]
MAHGKYCHSTSISNSLHKSRGQSSHSGRSTGFPPSVTNIAVSSGSFHASNICNKLLQTSSHHQGFSNTAAVGCVSCCSSGICHQRDAGGSEGHFGDKKKVWLRYLSHKFHGKGPGRNKVEKRMKRNEQEGMSISQDLVMSCYL